MADRLHIFILDFLFFFDYNIKSLRLNRIVFLHRLAVLLILILLCLISSLLFWILYFFVDLHVLFLLFLNRLLLFPSLLIVRFGLVSPLLFVALVMRLIHWIDQMLIAMLGRFMKCDRATILLLSWHHYHLVKDYWSVMDLLLFLHLLLTSTNAVNTFLFVENFLVLIWVAAARVASKLTEEGSKHQQNFFF